MKVFVKVKEEWLTILCNGKETLRWLGNTAITRGKKYILLKSGKTDKSESEESMNVNSGEWSLLAVRDNQSRSLLDLDDVIETVLADMACVLAELPNDKYSSSQSLNPNLTKSIEKEVLKLDGESLSVEDLMRLGRGEVTSQVAPEAAFRVQEARKLIDNIVKENKVVYGITTGFGKFANVTIPSNELKILQENLIRSHSAGVGTPLTPARTRMLIGLRINVLCKGYSGISEEVLQQYVNGLNANCLPLVPEKGTVGASGDLAPLSHLALGYMGEGQMWSPETGICESHIVLQTHGLKPIKLGPKEGLALINGTQLITSLGAEAVYRASAVALQADYISALTLEVLKGTRTAVQPEIHLVRPHAGQGVVASRLRKVLHSQRYPSAITESHAYCANVQDSYTLRCIPQVHGIVHDTIAFVRQIITTEMNSATDNPLVFAELGKTMSGGNFHGEYPAKALDYLGIGIHELSSISERRIDRLMNSAYSQLPAFLVREGGINSGFMIAHCTAAALVSENKVLCHPSSVDSLSTSAGTEDHVSMGGWSARKVLQIIENVETVIAIELLASCQALEFHRPKTTTAPLEAIHALVRETIPSWDKDRYMSPDIEAAIKLIQEQKILEVVKPFLAVDVLPAIEVKNSLAMKNETTIPFSRKRLMQGRRMQMRKKKG